MPKVAKKLICIVGPTAVGKTAMTIELAQRLKTDVISADSRQFYREMSIGTAKPSKEELLQVKHHFINSHSVKNEVTAGGFEKECLDLLNQLYLKTDKLLLTGGSGLYIQAVTDGIPKMPKVEKEIRNELNQDYQTKGIEYLQEKLLKVDPDYYREVELSNPQRLIRAIEVYQSTGKKFSVWRQGKKEERTFDTIMIGLERSREELYSRINKRVDLMMNDGLLDEVRSLLAYKDKPALKTVGYKEIFDHLNGMITLEEAISLIKRNSRRYAKRQMTWFKKNQSITWFNAEAKTDIFDFVEAVS